MRKINWDNCTVAHRHSSKLWPYDAKMLSVVPGKELCSTLLLLGVCAAFIMAHCKTNADCYFCFSPFFLKWKFSLNFFWLKETSTDIGLP